MRPRIPASQRSALDCMHLNRLIFAAVKKNVMKLVWQSLSVISHPLLIVTYGLLLMMWSNPFLFGAATVRSQIPFLWVVLFSTFLIPSVAVGLMRGLNMIKSLSMEERRERVGPLFAACILYSAFYFNVKRSNAMPEPFAIFILGALISLFCCLFINSFYKISLHAVGLSGLVMGMFIFYFSGYSDTISLTLSAQTLSFHFIIVPIALLILTGIISSGRMALQVHKLDEILAGWLVGVLGQVVAVLLH